MALRRAIPKSCWWGMTTSVVCSDILRRKIVVGGLGMFPEVLDLTSQDDTR